MASVYRGIIAAPEALCDRMRAERPAVSAPNLPHWAIKHAAGLACVCHGCVIPQGWRKVGAGPSSAHFAAGMRNQCRDCGQPLPEIPVGREVDTSQMQSRTTEIN